MNAKKIVSSRIIMASLYGFYDNDREAREVEVQNLMDKVAVNMEQILENNRINGLPHTVEQLQQQPEYIAQFIDDSYQGITTSKLSVGEIYTNIEQLKPNYMTHLNAYFEENKGYPLDAYVGFDEFLAEQDDAYNFAVSDEVFAKQETSEQTGTIPDIEVRSSAGLDYSKQVVPIVHATDLDHKVEPTFSTDYATVVPVQPIITSDMTITPVAEIFDASKEKPVDKQLSLFPDELEDDGLDL